MRVTLNFMVSRLSFIPFRRVVRNQVLTLDLSRIVTIKDQPSYPRYNLS